MQDRPNNIKPIQNVNRPRAIPLEDVFADIEQGSVWEGFSRISEIADCLLPDHRGNGGEGETTTNKTKW